MKTTSGHAWRMLSWHMLSCAVSVTLPKNCWPWGSWWPPHVSAAPGGAPRTLAPAYLEPCGAGRRCLEPRSPPGGGRRAAAAGQGRSRAASSCWIQIPIELGRGGGKEREGAASSQERPGSRGGFSAWVPAKEEQEGGQVRGGDSGSRRRDQRLPAVTQKRADISPCPSLGLLHLRALPSCQSRGSSVPTSNPLLRREPTVGHAWGGGHSRGTRLGFGKTLSSVAVRAFRSSRSGPQGER